MKFFFLAGEASGDLHGANLSKAIKKLNPEADLYGWGGEKMKKAGVLLSKNYDELAIMGFVEIVTKLPAIFRNLQTAVQEVFSLEIDAVVLIDFSGFNLRLAKKLRKKGFTGKIFYYISPKLWVWNKKRVKSVKRYIDKMFCILPFEVDFYEEHDYHDAVYIGNPLMDEIESFKPNKNFYFEQSLKEKPIIALLPGSRSNEIKKILPEMLKVVGFYPNHQFVIAGVKSVQELIKNELQKSGKSVPIVYDQTYDLVVNSELALVTSGTATLEVALLNTPFIICYKGSAISMAIAKMLVDIDFIGLPNLILNKEMVKELIQNDLNGENLKNEMDQLLYQPEQKNQFYYLQSKLARRVGEAGASERAARKMVKLLS